MEDFGDDEYFDGSYEADLGNMLTLSSKQPQDHDTDDVTTTSDDVSTASDDVISDVDSLKEDFDKLCKMRKEKEKYKVKLLIIDNILSLSLFLVSIVEYFFTVVRYLMVNKVVYN